MRPSLLIAVAVALGLGLGVLPARAVEVPLPGLVGGYEGSSVHAPDFGHPDQRSMPLIIPAEVTAIDQVELVLAMTWTPGELVCDFDQPTYEPWSPPLSLFLTSDAFPGDFFFASVETPDGAGEGRATLESCCPAGALPSDVLLGAELTATLFIDGAIIGICAVTVDTHGTVADAWLEVTGVVTTEATTWSQVKGLYR
jgi:hypothetical protein